MSTLPYCYEYPHPAVTTDCVIFGFDGTKLKVLLIRRGIEPFKGRWAFPGGFLQPDETAETGALRELREETGIGHAYLEQLHTFTDPERDPRERVSRLPTSRSSKSAKCRAATMPTRRNGLPSTKFRNWLSTTTGFSAWQCCDCASASIFVPSVLNYSPRNSRSASCKCSTSHSRSAFRPKKLHKEDVASRTPTELDETTRPTPKREAKLFRFNLENNEELKQKGFKLEF